MSNRAEIPQMTRHSVRAAWGKNRRQAFGLPPDITRKHYGAQKSLPALTTFVGCVA